MKPKNPLESAFFQTASHVMLGMLAVMNVPQFVQAEVNDFATTKQHTQAQVLAQSSLGVGNAGEQQDSDREQLLQMANALFKQGNLTGAEKNLRDFNKKFPDDSYGHYQLGNVLFRQGKKEDAIKEYQSAIRLDSKYAVAYNAIGQVFASQQRWSDATAEYQKALSINPDYGDALINLAQALWEQGKPQEARASLEKALNIFKAQERREKVQQIEQILQQMKPGNNPKVN